MWCFWGKGQDPLDNNSSLSHRVLLTLLPPPLFNLYFFLFSFVEKEKTPDFIGEEKTVATLSMASCIVSVVILVAEVGLGFVLQIARPPVALSAGGHADLFRHACRSRRYPAYYTAWVRYVPGEWDTCSCSPRRRHTRAGWLT